MPPKEHATPDVLSLQALVNSLGDDAFSQLPPLAPADLQLIGMLVQLFSFVELNLRRSVEIFVRAGHLAGTSQVGRYKSLNASELVPVLRTALQRAGMDGHEVAECSTMLDEIEGGWNFRHLVAHWAARRIPDTDAIVLFCMDERETKKLGKPATPKEAAQTAIMKLADLRGLVTHMVTVERWIAQKTSDWHLKHNHDDVTA